MAQKKPRSSSPYILEEIDKDYSYNCYVWRNIDGIDYSVNPEMYVFYDVDPTKCAVHKLGSTAFVVNGALFSRGTDNPELMEILGDKRDWEICGDGNAIGISNGKIAAGSISTSDVSTTSWGALGSQSASVISFPSRTSSDRNMYLIDSNGHLVRRTYSASYSVINDTHTWVDVVGEYGDYSISGTKYRHFPLALDNNGKLYYIYGTSITRYNIEEPVVYISGGLVQYGTSSYYRPFVVTDSGKAYVITNPSANDFVYMSEVYGSTKKILGQCKGSNLTTLTDWQAPVLTESGQLYRGYNLNGHTGAYATNADGTPLHEVIGKIVDICGSNWKLGNNYNKYVAVYAATEDNKLYVIQQGDTGSVWWQLKATKVLNFDGEVVNMQGRCEEYYDYCMMITRVPKGYRAPKCINPKGTITSSSGGGGWTLYDKNEFYRALSADTITDGYPRCQHSTIGVYNHFKTPKKGIMKGYHTTTWYDESATQRICNNWILTAYDNEEDMKAHTNGTIISTGTWSGKRKGIQQYIDLYNNEYSSQYYTLQLVNNFNNGSYCSMGSTKFYMLEDEE